MSDHRPKLGACIYRAMDGKSDYAAVVTLIEPGEDRVSLSTFPPGANITCYTRVRFDCDATTETVKPGTAYLDKA
jgi:hypothetical protein